MTVASLSRDSLSPGRSSQKLESVRSYKILDTDPEKAFDDLTILALHICEPRSR
jgi:hypothetical protein